MTTRLLMLALSLALSAGCQPAPVTSGTPNAPSGPTVAALPAETLIAGRALVGAVPLANAEVVLFDPIADAPPLGPGAGDGIRLESRALSLRTDADGRFTLPLTLKAGQAAEVYVSDGAQSVCGVLIGPAFAVRNAGKTPIDAEHPLLLDMESTTTAGVMLGSLKALGKAAAKRRSQGPDAVLALQAKALDTMASVVGETAAKLAALAGTADIAQKIAQHMVQADPRLPSPAKRTVLDVVQDANPVLGAVVRALRESGGTTLNEIRDTLEEGENTLRRAEEAAFQDDAGFVADLASEQTPAAEAPPRPVSDGVPRPANDSPYAADASVQVNVQPGSLLDPADTSVQIGSSLVVTGPLDIGDLKNVAWFDTGVALSAGQEFRIKPAEVAYHDGLYYRLIGPWGNSDLPRADCWVPNGGSLGNYGAMIGRIGPNGQPFAVGEGRPFAPAEASGNLFVTINNSGPHADTTGAISVTVSTR